MPPAFAPQRALRLSNGMRRCWRCLRRLAAHAAYIRPTSIRSKKTPKKKWHKTARQEQQLSQERQHMDGGMEQRAHVAVEQVEREAGVQLGGHHAAKGLPNGHGAFYAQ